MRAQDTAVAADPLVGRLVDDRFLVQAEIGSGAVGTVFRASDRQARREVALKVWRGCEDAQSRGRFVREAKALQTLIHPHIVAIEAMGFVDDSPYVAMELLSGQTLEDAIEHGPLSPERAVAIAEQVLSAVAFAHAQGVIHRDLKPENIFLARDGRGREVAKLLDYGLAKFLAPDDDPLKGDMITVTGMVMGTPLYMPPEQASGSKVDLRADVYALGCIMFEMFTGRLPYLGDDFGQLLRAHLTQPIPQITDVLTDVQVVPELTALLARAMAKQPGGRFPDAGQMRAALAAAPRPVLRPKPTSRASRPSRPSSVPARSQVQRRYSNPAPIKTARYRGPTPNYMLISAVVSGLILATATAVALLR